MTELNFKAIGANIKKRRLTLGVTQEAIANYLDVNPSHISNIECGRSNPSLTVLVRIADMLQCSVDVFIHNEYTFCTSGSKAETLDDMIMEKVKNCDIDKKNRVLKMIDLL